MASEEDVKIVMHVLAKREDYYAVLNIQKAATEDEIKRAYKKMALKLHPDKNKHPKAEEAFKHVSTAHVTLSDAEKRRIYDRHGVSGVQQHEQRGGAPANPFAAAGGAGGIDPEFFQAFFGGAGQQARRGGGGGEPHFHATHINLNDLFADFFGGGGGAAGQKPNQTQQRKTAGTGTAKGSSSSSSAAEANTNNNKNGWMSFFNVNSILWIVGIGFILTVFGSVLLFVLAFGFLIWMTRKLVEMVRF